MAHFVDINGDSGEPSSRMVVFVPENIENIANFARQIYIQAVTQQRDVLYLALISRETDQLEATRQLATLKALTKGSSVFANSLQVKVEDWPEVLRQLTHPGDTVILPEDRWLAPTSLENELNIAQKVLPGVRASSSSQPLSWYYSLLFWLIALTILVGFSYLEYRLTGLTSGLTLTVALILLITLELSAMYKLNQIFG